jgi:RimJ/RimL family protein N-acetyltransferase
VPERYTTRDAEDFLTHWAEGWRRDSEHGFAIETDGRWAGTIDLRPQGHGLAEVGFGLNAWARGRSVMSRAVRMIASWGFLTRGYHVIQWRAQVGNWPSRRVAWATGFRMEGTITALLEHRGRRVDGWVASLRRGEPMVPSAPWWQPVRLQGDGVMLREHRESDIPRMVEACRDPVSRHWLTLIPADYGERHARDHLRRIGENAASGRAVSWAVTDPGSDRLIGEVMISARGDTPQHGEVGYWIHPDARGRGAATAAARLAVRHAVLPIEDGGLGMDRILLRAADGNVASQRVAERLGFTRTGVDRDANRMRDGSMTDDIRFDLLPTELLLP